MGELRYRVLEGWEQLPEGFHHGDVDGVGVDSRDRVFLFTREEARVLVYDRDGSFVASWGEDLFTPRTHGLTVAPDDTVFCVDEGHNAVYHFTAEGRLLQTIGTPDVASDTGYDGTLSSIRPGPPFNRPTNLAVAPSGDLYVSDGYGNCRVHRFTAGGELIQSWGEPGTGPGEFNLVHGILVLADGRVLVADRENDRIQFFSPEGEYLEEWTDVQRPTNLAVDGEGRIYVSELWRPAGDLSERLGVNADDLPGRVSVYDGSGAVLARWGGADRTAAGNFVAPHDVCVDSHGDIYVGEVTWTFGIKPGKVPAGTHAVQKFARID
ncbi:MAG TPA: peptidyl-alpha-hydroxyglycine alpha-amidating lyase family protein [Candidatus Dormibacteraeota bacterium]|jgi:sugar lactone lactonase YvrE|nr:peptidyl-alpha-hydroxyglycine alpha-amidating lyase family protein [Candidatus Dormibacteraeota bacterium]